MKIDIASFSPGGAALAAKLVDRLQLSGHAVRGYTMPAYAEGGELGGAAGLQPFPGGPARWTADRFNQVDALVFIGACGIAVRMIAPWVKDKKTDPAVVVIDEGGKHSISLLSGHMGGANRLAREIARLTGGQAVISTATDVNGYVGIDEWAVEHDCFIAAPFLVKDIASALLKGQEVGFHSLFAVQGPLPKGYRLTGQGAGQQVEAADGQGAAQGRPDLGVNVTLYKGEEPFQRTLNLYPRVLSIGVGCRRDTSLSQIEAAVQDVLDRYNLMAECLRNAASINLKDDEPGLRAWAESRKLEFLTFDAPALNRVEGRFTPSPFVQSVTGVDNVCERAAVLASDCGQLLVGKTAKDGVTVAVARRPWEIRFDA